MPFFPISRLTARCLGTAESTTGLARGEAVQTAGHWHVASRAARSGLRERTAPRPSGNASPRRRLAAAQGHAPTPYATSRFLPTAAESSRAPSAGNLAVATWHLGPREQGTHVPCRVTVPTAPGTTSRDERKRPYPQRALGDRYLGRQRRYLSTSVPRRLRRSRASEHNAAALALADGTLTTPA